MLMKLSVFLVFVHVCAMDDDMIINKFDFNYEPNWESLDSRPLPDWYDEAKVGIFIHWGVYSVPSFGTEWFWTNWRDSKNPNYTDYMERNFKPGFTYQEFAKDFNAEHFNPNDWVKLFEKSGAKYIVFTSKHHEGYTMWPSRYAFSWNSVDIGPHRDIVGELAEAVRENSTLRFGLYYSLFEWFNPLYMIDRENSFQTYTYAQQKVIPELKDIVETYKPEVIWSDGDWEPTDEYWNSTEFIAWLYNESPVRETVVTNDRWGSGVLCKHGGFFTCQDRFNPGTLQDHKFENAMTIDKNSWGHRAVAKLENYITIEQLITEIVTTVSCGGNILINVGPNKYGLIEPIFEERLTQMGEWLDINGEAIYDTIPWKYQNDTQTTGVWYTSRKSDETRETIYAIVLEYPYEASGVNLFSFSNIIIDDNTIVHLLGFSEPLVYYKSNESLYVTFPNKQNLDAYGLKYAWTLKIDIPVQ